MDSETFGGLLAGLPAAARDEPAPSDLAAGRLAAQANALNPIGWNSALLSEYQQALPYCQQALGLLRDLGDRPGQAATLDSLGGTDQAAGNPQAARECWQQSLAIRTDLGHPRRDR